jgi:hypothetical protein
MTNIYLSSSQEINGITVTLSFSISAEALMREGIDCPKSSACCDTLSALEEVLLHAAEKEITLAVSTARQKLQLALISSATQHLRDEIKELNKE